MRRARPRHQRRLRHRYETARPSPSGREFRAAVSKSLSPLSWRIAVSSRVVWYAAPAGETGPIVCGCAPGWSGPNCEYQMDCIWGTFLNADPPKCLCQRGYSGEACDIPLPEPIEVRLLQREGFRASVSVRGREACQPVRVFRHRAPFARPTFPSPVLAALPAYGLAVPLRNYRRKDQRLRVCLPVWVDRTAVQ